MLHKNMIFVALVAAFVFSFFDSSVVSARHYIENTNHEEQYVRFKGIMTARQFAEEIRQSLCQLTRKSESSSPYIVIPRREIPKKILVELEAIMKDSKTLRMSYSSDDQHVVFSLKD